jgi:hypothetical protein
MCSFLKLLYDSFSASKFIESGMKIIYFNLYGEDVEASGRFNMRLETLKRQSG